MSQVLVLGAVNAVGCRVAEALCDRDVGAVALVDDWMRASRLARLPLRMIAGRVTDQEMLRLAMVGCDVVLHCMEYDRPSESVSGRGMRGALQAAWHRSTFAMRRRNLEAAEAVLSASVQSGIGRVVCLNASAVPTAPEQAALRCHRERGLSVTVLRPATLYGPFCPWTIDAVRAVRRGRRPRVTRGRFLYVDHLVEAMLLAARTDAGAGQVFPLHDEEPASYEELLEAHARASGGNAKPASRAQGATTEPDADSEMKRARDLLGYDPKSTFVENMERTAAWIQWSRL